jgi:hypothetical protein
MKAARSTASASSNAPEPRFAKQRFVAQRFVAQRFVAQRFVAQRFVAQRFVAQRFVARRPAARRFACHRPSRFFLSIRLGIKEAAMKDFFGDAIIAFFLTIGFVTTVLTLHHLGLIFDH